MKHNMVLSSEGNSTIVLTDENLNTTTITDEHPNFMRIVDSLTRGEDPTEWINPSKAATVSVLTALSDKVSVDEEGKIHFDGDPVYDGLAETIERYRREGRDAYNLIRFMERLAQNPSERSREQLFTWTQAKELTIDVDGYIIAYKGVTDDMLSLHSGTALVDGVETTGQIPYELGTVIAMPRSEVNDDPNQGCSTGLHVGNWSYASSFGAVTLEVRVDPADVVSVPADCSFQKLRCCRLVPVAIHVKDEDDLDGYEPEATYDEDEAWDDFSKYVPQTFVERIKARLKGRK